MVIYKNMQIDYFSIIQWTSTLYLKEENFVIFSCTKINYTN